ncbi:hypothetical protein GL279_07415 [Paracoccus limosus]|jgi:hypothetical protein|uniref:Uncharacterized protein n=1 Tax=Paracoccus limosus TaxID=913252 RepID=A0A844H4E6_9RHOB|nr:hypothetical protein [Paracoccus limosus]MTH34424.1 hypothetical protein [Paracoccus limosus]
MATHCHNTPGLPDASLHIIRDMILLALDATEAPNLPEANRLEARAALAEALDVIEGAEA